MKENHGYYWSGSIDEWSDDYSDVGCLIFHQLGCEDTPEKRFSGYTVRPIVSNNLILASLSLSLSGGEVTTVEITSGSGNYSVESSKEEVATASIKDNLVYVTAVGIGCAKITVTDTQSGQKATIHVNIMCPDSHHPHAIDLGLSSGNLWACCNVGTNKPEDYGTYYVMEEIEEEKVNDSISYYEAMFEDIAKWGDNWNLPTTNAILELQNECSYSWATINGIEGLFFTGPNENGVFFPAAGVYYEGEVGGQGYNSSYWLGIEEDYVLSFDKNNFYYQPLLNKYNYDSSTTARLVQEQYEMND